nr:hypothetical protein [Tanacetum cinerariifolium]
YGSHTQSSTPLSITYPPNDFQSLVHHNVYNPSPSIPQVEYAPSVNQQSDFSQPDSGLIVPVFQKGDDLIDAINHMMSFLTAVVTSRYPLTNNQLRNSSNPRQQATINNERVTVQPIQGRHNSLAVGTSRTYTSGENRNNSGKQRTVVCYNCNGEGHMSKQCTKPKRKMDESWFKDKLLLVQAQANGKILHEEELAFLADLGITEAQTTQNVITHNVAYQAMLLSEQSNIVNQSETKITSDSNIIPYSQYINLDNKNVNETLTAELERYKDQVRILKEENNVDKEKDIVIKKLKERIKSLGGNMKEKKIKQELEEIETINIKLDHRVTKLIDENEHLKQTYKQLYDSIKSSHIRSKEQCDDLIKQVNIKSVKNSDLNASLQKKVLVITALKDTLRKIKGKDKVDEAIILHPIDPELLKINVAPLASKLRNNRTAHYDYLKHTKKETATLREIVEHERSLNPLNTSLDYACKYIKRIQELLIILKQTCPCINDLGDELMAMPLMNKTKKVRFTKPIGD